MGYQTNLRRKLILLAIVVVIVSLVIVLVAEVDNLIRFFGGVEEDVYFRDQNLGGYLPVEVEDLVHNKTSQLTSYPLPARLDAATGKIKPAVKGQIVDITATLNRIYTAKPDSKIEPVMYSLEPYLKAAEIEKINYELSSYSTIVTGSQSRKANIKLATKLIDNQLVAPGEVFSFNQVVGPRTKENGFQEGPEIIDGQVTTGVGGGICQVSSTLFNAIPAVDELKIIERHFHSRDVGYVPEGQDATVAWDYFDLKFKNKLASPVIIRAQLQGVRLKVVILGQKAGKEELAQKKLQETE
ncbi:VanW family protein [Halanaerobaculum tunisiense]